jgi:DNA modification methylase
MEIQLKKLKDLKPNPLNPRKSSVTQDENLKKSLEKFGVVEPIVFNKQSGYIVGGHFRVRELKKLGYKEVECVIVDLSPDDEKELLIRLNANTGDWDTDLLLQDWDADKLADWGVEMPEFESETTLEAQEDDYEIPDQIQTDIVLGDLFEIGEHRLLCGDSTDINAVGKLMKGEKIDTVITSPPYNQGGGKGDLFSHGKRNESLYQNDFDNKTKDEYFDFIISILNTILLFLNETHTIVWNVSYNAKSRDDYGKIIFSDKNPFTVKETIIWNKGGSINLPQEGIYSRKCELVFIMSNYDKYNSSQKYGDCRWNYWETTKVNQLSNHKATFPIEFAENAVNEFSIEKNLIFEPFCGSGTTMVASHQLKRKCYGMELDPKYCQVIVDRMKKLDTTLVIKKNGVVI